MLRDRRSGVILNNPSEAIPLRIVGDAAIASPIVGDGRFIPAVIVDTTDRPDIDEYIRVHKYVDEGDVKTQWGRLDTKRDSVVLILSVVRPVNMVMMIDFSIARQGILVEQILASKGLYIQAGRDGDRVKHNIDAPKVIMEIPDTGFRSHWDALFLKYVTADMRERGLGRQQARRAAKSSIEEIRKLGSARVPTPRTHKFD